jgi:hypothetical protein
MCGMTHGPANAAFLAKQNRRSAEATRSHKTLGKFRLFLANFKPLE